MVFELRCSSVLYIARRAENERELNSFLGNAAMDGMERMNGMKGIEMSKVDAFDDRSTMLGGGEQLTLVHLV